MRDDFCVFILSHGRADNVKTYKTLKRQKYNGIFYIVIDNEDDQKEEYIKNFGDKVIIFDKYEISKRFDTADLSEDRRTIVYARNACFDIAKEKGYKYFLELDDDYTSFQYRKQMNGKLKVFEFENINPVFEAFIEWLETSGAKTIAMAQGGDFIGGANSKNFQRKVLRKAMNTFFCKTDRRFWFVGRVNEDVNMYTTLGQRGELVLSCTDAMITQTQTQKTKGGMTETYLDGGTYLKSFYSVMYSPSCVSVQLMGDKHMRIHHNVEWEKCAPKILNARWKK